MPNIQVIVTQTMAWIEDALKVSHLEIDDLFYFDTNGFVISMCVERSDSKSGDLDNREMNEMDVEDEQKATEADENNEEENDEINVDPGIFIKNNTCHHLRGRKCDYATWKQALIDGYENQETWEKPLREEAFFRPENEIPGGTKLLERTAARKRLRADTFRGPHEFRQFRI